MAKTWLIGVLLFCRKETEVAQSCPTLFVPMDCSLPGSSLHGILQARVLEWVAISFSRGSSQLRDQTGVKSKVMNLDIYLRRFLSKVLKV